MILRDWRAPVAEEDVEPFADFMQDTLYPALEEQEAFVSMTTAVDRSGETPVVVAVSTWTSMDGLRAFTGPDEEGVIFEDAEAYLAGEPIVRHLEVLEHVHEGRAGPS